VSNQFKNISIAYKLSPL